MRSLKLRYSLIIFLLAPLSRLCGQSIGGVINTYYQVIEVLPAKSCVRVSNPSGLAQYDNTMLVQMKGAAVSTTNNASYGSVTALNNAGNYEMGVICGIIGDSVFFEQTLLNAYDVSGKVQLVRVPMYASATVVSPLVAGPWNNTSGTGGVLALIAINTLTLNAAVSADTMGFKGGAVKILSGTCGSLFVFSNYAYNPAVSTGGGYKGEGIADVTAANSGGRGPMANGGGGGGDHNNGAAGGGNLAAGGTGGDNNSTTGCNNKFPGLGGLALSNTGNKIYAGGGGGHGHSNNTVTPWGGGNGGGIVYIQADVLTGNNFTISAAGGDGSATIGDGGSGGGAGGTIMMEVGSYSGNVNIAVNGGKGGDVDNLASPNRSMGPGGGGSGGVIYFTGTLPAVTTSANSGAAGVSYNTSPAGMGGNNGAAAGTNGTVAAGYTVSRSGMPAAYCTALLLTLPNEINNYAPRARNRSGGSYMSIYPNPAGTFIGLHTSLRGWQVLQLYSADGKLVWSNNCLLQGNTAPVMLPSLQRGIYILSAGGLRSRLFIR